MMSRSLAVGMVFVALGAGAGALTGASPASKHERALRGTSEVKLCNSIGCPDGFTPVPSAWTMECDNNVCEVDQCCEAFCSYHACPDSFVPIENADSIRCRDNDCSTRQCCDRVTEGGDRRQRKLSDDTLYCNSIGCPDGFTPVPSAWTMECDNNVCEVDQCCEAFCSYHACPDSFVPIENADSIRCRDNDCSTRQCCDPVHD